MTITFENDNDVIVYALEKVISYARRTQQIFVAHCVWWLASIIGLEQGLITHIDNLQSRIPREVSITPQDTQENLRNRATSNIDHLSREVSTTPRDIQEDPRIRASVNYVHPSRQAQVQDSDDILSSSEITEVRQKEIAPETEKFTVPSRKQRKEFNQQIRSNLLNKRSGRIAKPITKKQKNYLQNISKDTIAEYLENRK
jgi:streptogramin lyase